MTTWMAKLALAVELRNAWDALDPAEYPEGPAKAMELVTHTVFVLFHSSCPALTLF